MESPCECGIEPPGSINHGVSELVSQYGNWIDSAQVMGYCDTEPTVMELFSRNYEGTMVGEIVWLMKVRFAQGSRPSVASIPEI